MPLADPDCATNGSKNAEIITLDLNLDQNLFKNFSALTDPFHEDINIFDDTTLKLFRTILMDVCQGNFGFQVLQQGQSMSIFLHN